MAQVTAQTSCPFSVYPSSNLGHVAKSVQYGKLSFPTLADYVQFYIQRGDIAVVEEFWMNDVLIADMQRHWHTRGQNGCVFAQAVADNSSDRGWESIVINAPFSEVTTQAAIEKLNAILAAAIASPSTQLISILFPQVREVHELVGLVRLLLMLEGMTHVESVFEDYIAVGLRLALAGGTVASWVMGFGSYDFLPNTRQAPVTEFVIRTKVKPETIFPRLNQDRSAAHLADTPLHFDDRVAEHLWHATYSRVRAILGGEPDRLSAAKTTFSFPIGMWS
jgi:hypothetical protein